MGSQSTVKTIFLLASMVGWLMVGAALIYLAPFMADRVVASDLTHTWMQTLSRGGYHPLMALFVGSMALAITGSAHIIWQRRFEGKI